MEKTYIEELELFFKEYEKRTNTHNFDEVRNLLDENAIYWFSDGTFIGLDEIRKAFIETWTTIQDELYTLHDKNWIVINENSAVCVYTFHWVGLVDGERSEGTGRGTNVFKKVNNSWKIIHEHLSTT